MTQESKQHESIPPAVWWMVGAIGFCFLAIWMGVGLDRAIWLFGLLAGTVIAAIISMFIRGALEDNDNLYGLADLVVRVFWIIAALLALFNALVAGSIVLGPVFLALAPVAQVLGWLVLLGGTLWAASRFIEQKKAMNEAIRDRDAQLKFEHYLSTEDPNKFAIYNNLKQKYDLERVSKGTFIHWQEIAQEAHVPTIQIIKNR